MHLRHPRPRVAALVLALMASSLVAQEPAKSSADPLAQPAELMTLAEHSLLLGIARAGDRYIAVGERGHILMSTDGSAWTQAANVPLRSTLTAVTAVGNNVWAVGHDGVILHSADAGETWTIQRRDPWQEAPEGEEHDLRQGVPLLDVLFTDASNGIAIGAYSLLLTTNDGGKTWNGARIHSTNDASDDSVDDDEIEEPMGDTFSAEQLRIGQESDPHLNAIARTGSGALVIVGERGAVFHSRDAGATWERSQLPYDGSMFGVIAYDNDHVLAFGLRGHVFESTDLGETWTEIPTGTELSLMGGASLPDGGAIVVGANGTILQRAAGESTFNRFTSSAAGAIAGVVPVGSGGELLIAGENGVSRYQPK
jgi:photosystem II stability/assembly factor-like uncharacterized protein